MIIKIKMVYMLMFDDVGHIKSFVLNWPWL